MGSAPCSSGASAKASNGLVQQTVHERQERDRLRLAGLRQGHQRRRLQRRRLQPAARQVRRVRRRAQLLDGHARAPARGQRAAEVHQLDPELRARPEDRRRRTGSRSTRCSSGSEARGRTGAPSGARRAGVCASCSLIVLMIVFVAIRAWPSFQHNGLSWFSGKGDVDVQIGNQVNTGAKPDVRRLPARGLAADLGDDADDRLRRRHRPGLLGPGRDLHRRVRPRPAAPRDRARSCACSPPCRRSSTG